MKNAKILQWNRTKEIYKWLLAALTILSLLALSACAPADTDGDGITDDIDNCVHDPNPDQLNSDGADDGGDVCDPDDDNDMEPDETDNCPNDPNPDQLNSDANLGEGKADGLGDVCDPDDDGDDVDDVDDVDDDGDGLIELSTPEMLNNIRYNLLGTGYKTKAQFDDEPDLNEDPGDENGCGGKIDDNIDPITVCKGYELVPDGGDTLTLTENWPPIAGRFRATFDGNDNTIANLIIVGSNAGMSLGFFASIGDGGIVQNLRIEEVTITGTGLRAGSLAGELRSGGQVAGVGIVNADFSSTATTGINQPISTVSIGGLIGYGDGGSITNSYAMVAIRSTTRSVGGLVGQSTGRITNSYSTGDVSGTGNDIGGLVGYSDGGSITNSYSTGDVSSTGNNIGGLVGDSDGRITNSYSTGDVSGTGNIGGLVGRNFRNITNSYSTGDVSGTGNNIGGLVGRNFSASITNSYIDTSHARDEIGRNSGSATNVEKKDLKGLTEILSGWSNNDWDFGDDTQYPALRSSTANDDGTYPILCGQVELRASPPEGQCQ